MTVEDKDRFINVLKAIAMFNFDGLPKFIIDSSTEGLQSLVENLIKTGFLIKYENKNEEMK